MARTRKIRKKKTQKDREVLYSDNSVIDIDKEREARRLELRRKAEAKQRRTGRKSIKEEMMEEVRAAEQPEEANSEGKAAAVKMPRRKALSTPKKLLLILLVLLLIVFAVSIGSIVQLKQQESAAEQEVAELKVQKAELQKKVSDLDSDEYIERQARNWLKMAKQGDMVYVMEGDSIEQNSGVTKADEEADAASNTNEADNSL